MTTTLLYTFLRTAPRRVHQTTTLLAGRWLYGLLVLTACWATPTGKAHAQIITTVAGSDSKGDGGLATNASLNNPGSVAVDALGNLYIVDYNNNRIRKVAASDGTITTMAGNGSYDFSGDGGPAVDASLFNPTGVAVDGSGNLYIADSGNQRIRKVAANDGTITTVAGNGSYDFSGDGGPAISASLFNPTGVAVDGSGNLYIADLGNNRIRKVAASDGTITTVAGNGSQSFSGDGGPAVDASLNSPTGVAVDGSGNLYIADYYNQRSRKVAASDGTITTVAGNGSVGFSGDGGAAVNASLGYPYGVALDGSGNLYIVDSGNQRIRKVAASDGTITTVAGNGSQSFSGDSGPAVDASLNSPNGVAVDGSGNLYIADLGNNRIRKVAASDGTITTVAGNGSQSFSGDGGPATSASLNYPRGVAVHGAGNLYIADYGNQRIRKVAASDGTITTMAGNGTYGFSGDGGPATSASLFNPIGVAVDGAGNLYIVDQYNHRIRKVAVSTGTITTVAGNGSVGFSGDGGPATSASLSNPIGVAVDGSGNLYIVDYNNNRIRKVTASDGTITTVAGNGSYDFSGDGGPAVDASLGYPYGVALDGSGNLYIADLGNNRIRKVAASDGTITTVAGNGSYDFSGDGGAAISASLTYPIGVAVDGSGNLYIADLGNNRIRRVAASDGTITTVAGNGSRGFSGDGGAATSASLSDPTGVAVDGAGNLYIADYGNNRIRKVNLPSPNTAPTIALSIPAQTITVGQAFNYTLPANAFTDAETPNGLTYSARIVPANGLSFDPGTQVIAGTPTASGVSSVTIVATDPGSLTASQTFTITVNPASTLTAGTVTGTITACAGTASTASQSFAVSGSNLTANLVATAPAGFEISSSSTSGFGASVSLSPSGGAVANTTLYVRSSASASGSISGNVTLASTGATAQNVAVSGTVNALPTASIAGNLAIVTGQTTTLIASGGTTFVWNTNETTAAISATAGTYSVTVTSGGCQATATATVTASPAIVDLRPSFTLPQTSFAATGSEATRQFTMSVFETGGQPTTSGSIVVTITLPLGYSITFDNALTSIAVTGGSTTPVNNANWNLTASSALQLTLTMKAGQRIEANGQSTLGFSLMRSGASKGAANLTVNVADDGSRTYDVNPANNVYAQILSAL